MFKGGFKSGSVPFLVVWLQLVTAVGAQRPALPGYNFAFPRDHFDHPDFATEWWYFTGNLSDESGRPFGFELTFFRQAIRQSQRPPNADQRVWNADQLYLAHFALSDIQEREFFHTQRLNRSGPELAGISENQARYWNGNWQVQWEEGTRKAKLQAISGEARLQLTLEPEKGPVVHGHNGISQKGPDPGNASHYISFTRLAATGTLTWKAKPYPVHGLAWMDHEFFSHQLDESQRGWDWFSVQLENNEEFMFYRLRKKNGDGDPYSSGTFVDGNGISHPLDGKDFVLEPTGETWTSPSTQARYPIGWRLSVPSLGLDLIETTPLENQELDAKGVIGPSYWEGSVRYAGTRAGQPIEGSGYLEMTGYDRALILGEQ